MSEQVTDYSCLACGGPVRFDAGAGKLKCDYCDSTFTVEQMKEAFARTNEQVVDRATQAQARATEEENWGVAENMKAYLCQACGAEIVCDPTVSATNCPYCDSNVIMPQQFDGMMRPRYVIPFKVDKQGISDKLKSYYKGKKLLPKSFSDQNHLDDVKGVYVPFWLYSGSVDAEMRYDAQIKNERRTSSEVITTIKHYKVHRKGLISFDKIPTDASKSMPDDLMDSIEPYDYSEMKPFEMEYLLGFLADKYDVSKEESLERARKRAEGSAVSALNSTLSEYTSYQEISPARRMEYKDEKSEYAMFPVWLLSTKWNNQNFLFAVNGQTGKMIGNLPIDKTKQVLWNLGVSVPLFLLILLVSGSLEIGTIFFGLIIAGLAALITNGVLVGQMKPVSENNMASGYVNTQNGEALKLSIKQDDYTNTTEQRRKIDK